MIEFSNVISIGAEKLLNDEDFVEINRMANEFSSSWDRHYFFFKYLFRYCNNESHAEALDRLFESTCSEYNLIYLRLVLIAERDMFHRFDMKDKEEEIYDRILNIRCQQAQAVEDAVALRLPEEVH